MSGDPDKILKERMKEEKRLAKQKAKLEKKFKSGKIDEATYRKELDRIGYVTQKDLVEDFRRMIQEEIEYLENLEVEGQAGNAVPPPPPPPPPGADPYADDFMKAFEADKKLDDARKKGSEPFPDLDFKPPVVDHEDAEPEYEELSEDMADWDLDEDTEFEDEFEEVEVEEDEEPEFEDDYAGEDDYIDEGHDHDIGEVPIDRREGVLEYDEIKQADFSKARIMDSYADATVLGEPGKRRRKKKRKESKDEIRAEAAEEELSEAEKLIRELEADSDELLDLDEVFIPDVESTIKSKKVSSKVPKAKVPSIMWEADVEDQRWVQKRFLEEAAELAKRHKAWRQRSKDKVEVPEWEVYRLVKKTVSVKEGKRTVKRKVEVWKVRESKRGREVDSKIESESERGREEESEIESESERGGEEESGDIGPTGGEADRLTGSEVGGDVENGKDEIEWD